MKKTLFISISLLVLGGILFKGAEYWISHKIKNSLNTRATRNYDLIFEELDVKLLQGKAELKHILLVPLHDNLPFEVKGSMDRMRLNNVKLIKYIFNKDIEIGELRLENPSFRLTRKDSTTNVKQSSRAFQDLFGDIIRRGIIRNFVVEGGNAELLIQRDSLTRFASFTDLSIVAEGVQTDSAIVTHAVPFQLEKITTGIKNLSIKIAQDQDLSVGSVDFNFNDKYLSIKDIVLEYDREIIDKSHQTDFQSDLFEIAIKEIRFDRLNAESDLYGDWSVISENMLLDSLVMVDVRNKNKPRPQEFVKPMFAGMLSNIPFPLDIDTLTIKNSSFTYIEVPEGNQKGGEIYFENLEAKIAGLITIDSLQKSNELIMDVQANFMGSSHLDSHFTIPYDQDYFSLDLSLTPFDMGQVNPAIFPLANIYINSGDLKKLRMRMEGRSNSAFTTLEFDYENLKLEIHKNGSLGKNGTVSMLANMAIRSENLPGKNNHRIAQYSSFRNPYRGPFNFIWETTKTGLLEITPGGLVKLFSSNSSKPYPSKKN